MTPVIMIRRSAALSVCHDNKCKTSQKVSAHCHLGSSLSEQCFNKEEAKSSAGVSGVISVGNSDCSISTDVAKPAIIDMGIGTSHLWSRAVESKSTDEMPKNCVVAGMTTRRVARKSFGSQSSCVVSQFVEKNLPGRRNGMMSSSSTTSEVADERSSCSIRSKDSCLQSSSSMAGNSFASKDEAVPSPRKSRSIQHILDTIPVNKANLKVVPVVVLNRPVDQHRLRTRSDASASSRGLGKYRRTGHGAGMIRSLKKRRTLRATVSFRRVRLAATKSSEAKDTLPARSRNDVPPVLSPSPDVAQDGGTVDRTRAVSPVMPILCREDFGQCSWMTSMEDHWQGMAVSPKKSPRTDAHFSGKYAFMVGKRVTSPKTEAWHHPRSTRTTRRQRLVFGRRSQLWRSKWRTHPRSRLSCPDIDVIDGIEFLSFESEDELKRFIRNNPEKVYQGVPLRVNGVLPGNDLRLSGFGGPILPTKTKDITKIKGWRNKVFAPEAICLSTLGPLRLTEMCPLQRALLVTNFSRQELCEHGLWDVLSQQSEEKTSVSVDPDSRSDLPAAAAECAIDNPSENVVRNSPLHDAENDESSVPTQVSNGAHGGAAQEGTDETVGDSIDVSQTNSDGDAHAKEDRVKAADEEVEEQQDVAKMDRDDDDGGEAVEDVDESDLGKCPSEKSFRDSTLSLDVLNETPSTTEGGEPSIGMSDIVAGSPLFGETSPANSLDAGEITADINVVENLTNKSAFVSDFLDQFLKNQSELNVSLTKATEKSYANPEDIDTKVVWPSQEEPVEEQMARRPPFRQNVVVKPREAHRFRSLKNRRGRPTRIRDFLATYWKGHAKPQQSSAQVPAAKPAKQQVPRAERSSATIKSVVLSGTDALFAATALVSPHLWHRFGQVLLPTPGEITKTLNRPAMQCEEAKRSRAEACRAYTVNISAQAAESAAVAVPFPYCRKRPRSVGRSPCKDVQDSALSPPPPEFAGSDDQPVDKASDAGAAVCSVEPPSSTVEERRSSSCDKEFCQLGCVCDSLRVRKRRRKHCGKVQCMFECVCEGGAHKATTVAAAASDASPPSKNRRQIRIPAKLKDSVYYYGSLDDLSVSREARKYIQKNMIVESDAPLDEFLVGSRSRPTHTVHHRRRGRPRVHPFHEPLPSPQPKMDKTAARVDAILQAFRDRLTEPNCPPSMVRGKFEARRLDGSVMSNQKNPMIIMMDPLKNPRDGESRPVVNKPTCHLLLDPDGSLRPCMLYPVNMPKGVTSGSSTTTTTTDSTQTTTTITDTTATATTTTTTKEASPVSTPSLKRRLADFKFTPPIVRPASSRSIPAILRRSGSQTARKTLNPTGVYHSQQLPVAKGGGEDADDNVLSEVKDVMEALLRQVVREELVPHSQSQVCRRARMSCINHAPSLRPNAPAGPSNTISVEKFLAMTKSVAVGCSTTKAAAETPKVGLPKSKTEKTEEGVKESQDLLRTTFTHLAMVASSVVKDMWRERTDSIPITAFVFRMAATAIDRLRQQEKKLVSDKHDLVRQRMDLFRKYTDFLKGVDSNKQKETIQHLARSIQDCCMERMQRKQPSEGKKDKLCSFLFSSFRNAVGSCDELPSSTKGIVEPQVTSDVVDHRALSSCSLEQSEKSGGSSVVIESETDDVECVDEDDNDPVAGSCQQQQSRKDSPADNLVKTIRVLPPKGGTEWVPLQISPMDRLLPSETQASNSTGVTATTNSMDNVTDRTSRRDRDECGAKDASSVKLCQAGADCVGRPTGSYVKFVLRHEDEAKTAKSNASLSSSDTSKSDVICVGMLTNSTIAGCVPRATAVVRPSSGNVVHHLPQLAIRVPPVTARKSISANAPNIVPKPSNEVVVKSTPNVDSVAVVQPVVTVASAATATTTTSTTLVIGVISTPSKTSSGAASATSNSVMSSKVCMSTTASSSVSAVNKIVPLMTIPLSSAPTSVTFDGKQVVLLKPNHKSPEKVTASPAATHATGSQVQVPRNLSVSALLKERRWTEAASACKPLLPTAAKAITTNDNRVVDTGSALANSETACQVVGDDCVKLSGCEASVNDVDQESVEFLKVVSISSITEDEFLYDDNDMLSQDCIT